MNGLTPEDLRAIKLYMDRAHEAIVISGMLYMSDAREQTLEVAEKYLLLAFEEFKKRANINLRIC